MAYKGLVDCNVFYYRHSVKCPHEATCKATNDQEVRPFFQRSVRRTKRNVAALYVA